MSGQPDEKGYAKRTNREEWLFQNEGRIREFWNAMRNFLDYNNSFLLDRCTYESLSDFIANNSTHWDEKD